MESNTFLWDILKVFLWCCCFWFRRWTKIKRSDLQVYFVMNYVLVVIRRYQPSNLRMMLKDCVFSPMGSSKIPNLLQGSIYVQSKKKHSFYRWFIKGFDDLIHLKPVSWISRVWKWRCSFLREFNTLKIRLFHNLVSDELFCFGKIFCWINLLFSLKSFSYFLGSCIPSVDCLLFASLCVQ